MQGHPARRHIWPTPYSKTTFVHDKKYIAAIYPYMDTYMNVSRLCKQKSLLVGTTVHVYSVTKLNISTLAIMGYSRVYP